MNNDYSNSSELLRSEIAALAARMIAEDGADYGSAKRKAAKQILGNAKPRSDILPDNAQVEDEVRIYNEIFFADTQPARLLHLRQTAAALMLDLQAFAPHLTGAVLNGTANEQSDIHLQLFADSAKDVEIFLLNKNMPFEVSETPHFKGRSHEPVETVSFMWHNEGVHLHLYQTDDVRGALRTGGGRFDRADLRTVQQLITESEAL
jgi:hypothetical protein